MFTSKKNKNDVAGSTQRFVDVRRDAPSRYKHFRFVVDSLPDVVDRRNFIEQYAFEAFHLFHELISQVDTLSSHGSGPRNITELEYALWLLEFLLCNLPEYIAQRWQFNAVASTLKKISHPQNTLGLRRIAVRLFVLWYQILGVGQLGADDLDSFFASLVPNLSRGKGTTSDIQLLELCEKISSTSTNVDTTFSTKKSTPLAPAMAEKGPSNVSKGLLTQAYMEKLLEAVSTESTKIEWKTQKVERTKQCIKFLLDKIKRYYAPTTFAGSQMDVVDVACPKIPTNGGVALQRNAIILPIDEDPSIVCAQCLARWAAMYSFSHRKQSDSLSNGDQSFNKMIQQQSPSTSNAVASRTPETKLPPNFEIMREMFFNSKTSTNFIFTILREGFLLPLTYAGTMGRVFKVLREWLIMDSDDECLPMFFAETSPSVNKSSSAVGVQKSLQTIVSVLASFFNNPYLVDEKERLPLILQISSRVLTLFKYLANGNNSESTHKMTLDSWMFILKVLLNVVRNCLPRTPPVGGDYPLAHRLAPQLYQTLLVTWVFAGLNVVMSSEMWEELLSTTSERNSWPALIAEWSKVMESVTRALGSQLYNVDLLNLPLERISEQKLKKIRGKMGENNNLASSTNDAPPPPAAVAAVTATTSYNFINVSPSTSTNGPMRPNRKVTTTPDPKVNRQHRLLQKSVDFVDSDFHQTSPPSDASSLDGSASLDSGVVAGSAAAVAVGEVENSGGELKSSLYDVVGDILASTPTMVDEDIDSVSEDFVLPDDVTIPNGVGVDDESPRFNGDDGQVFGAPETIAIMWRRMLCSLGDINQILDADIHLSCLEVVQKLVDMLLKIRDNQGVVVDSTPQIVYPPVLVPPYTIFVPWLLKVMSLSERYHKSKLMAVQLLCRLIVRRHDVALDENVKSKFYAIVHSILNDGDEELNFSLFRSCGAKIFYLPRGFGESCAEFLLSDYIRSVGVLLNSKLTTQNRQILIHFLSCVVNLPSTIVDVSRFYSIDSLASKSFTPVELQKQIVDCLRKNAVAAAAAASNGNTFGSFQSLKGLIIYVFSSLARRSTVQSDDVVESVNTLLSCMSTNVDVGHSVCQLFSCLLNVLPTSEDVYSNLHLKIIESMLSALDSYLRNSGQMSSSMQQNYVVRLLFDVTEWCLRLPKKFIHMKKISSTSSSAFVDGSSTTNAKPIVEIVAETLTSFVHNKFLSTNVKKVAESLISLLLRFFDQQSTQTCHVNEWMDRNENHESSSCLFLKFRKNFLLSVQPSSASVKFLTRQTAGKDCIEATRLKNNNNHSSVDVNQWLAVKKLTDSETSCVVKSPTKIQSRNLKNYASNEIISLPSFADADGSSLERMIYFLEKTSQECFPTFIPSSNVVGVNDARIETIAASIDQLHLHSRIHQENEFLTTNSMSSTLTNDALSSSHLFLDAVLNPTFEKRSQFKLLDKSGERLQREFKHVDHVLNREVHKIAVVYVGEGQEDKQSILKNCCGSKNFETFVAGLGYEVDLKHHQGYCGGLPSDAGTTAYWSTSTTEVLFHVSTRSLGDGVGGDWTKKLRHIGNDEIHIVWSEHWRDYRRNIIPTDFCDVLIVVYPLANHRLFRIQVEKNADVADFGPLFDGALIEWESLAPLVRCTAINASRAKRLGVDGYKNFLEHRCESLSNTIERLTVPSSYSNFLRSLWMVGTDSKKVGQRS